uniref:Large ribosomal subunit protein mL51 n=1 Tax=Gongylonema pulchrum TaxID=637853 RepID=A0A183EBQ5_9BILA
LLNFCCFLFQPSYNEHEIAPISARDVDSRNQISTAVEAKSIARPSSKCSQRSRVSIASIPQLCEPYDNFDDHSKNEALQPVSKHQKTLMPRSQQQQYPYEQSCCSISHALSWSSNKSLSSTAPLDRVTRGVCYMERNSSEHDPVREKSLSSKSRSILFGENDYTDLLGDGSLHPAQLQYHVPAWLRGFPGQHRANELVKLIHFRNLHKETQAG